VDDSQRPLVVALWPLDLTAVAVLALTLLVAWLGAADNSYNTFATYHFTVAANWFYRSSNFHFLSYPTLISWLD